MLIIDNDRNSISLHKRTLPVLLCKLLFNGHNSMETLKSWIDGLQARGRYTFLRSEAVNDSGLTPNAVSRALRRSIENQLIIQLKEYIYAIVPPEYRIIGSPPASWFIHALMEAMDRPYYVGLLSAAAHYGASNQQPQIFQVITNKPVRPIVAGHTKIQFFASKYVNESAISKIQTPTGSMRVSTPETTVVDLLRFVKASGQLDHVASIVAGLSSMLDTKRLLSAVRIVKDIPNVQRLGYLLDLIGQRKLSNILHQWLERRMINPQLLLPGRPNPETKLNRRWQLHINTNIEIEQ